MKVLKIILYVLLAVIVFTTLFINISPQFGSNPSRAQKQFFSSFKNFKNGEFKLFGRGSEADIRGCNLMLTGYAN